MIPNQWGILITFLVLVPIGVFYLADEISNGAVFTEQDDPSWEKTRQGVYNNTVLMAVSLDAILFIIWLSFNMIRFTSDFPDEDDVYNADGVRIK